MSTRGIAPLLLLLAGLAGVLFFRIGVPPVANFAEARVEGVVREMVQSGDWLVPRLHGEPRLHKPPGYYWLASALSNAVGETSWASVRAGSALATLGLVAVIFFWGRAIGGPALGMGAALCLSAMQFTLTFGRRGVAEMLLAFATGLALASFDRICFARDRRWLPVFALALALGILAKATVALLMVGLPIGLWLALDAPSRPTARALVPWSLAALAGGFLWYAYVLAAVPGALDTILSEAALPLGVRVAGAGTALHYELPTFYAGPLVSGTLPAVLLLPLALARCARTRLYASSPRLRFVALGFTALLAVLAVIPQKQRHYLLPLLPLIALLMAEAVLDLHARAPERLRQAMRWLAGLATPIGVAGLAALSCFYGDFLGVPQQPRLALLAGGAALLGGLVWSARAGRPGAFAGIAAAVVLAVMLAWFGSINIWRRDFEAGIATSRPDYEPARWAQASAEHPLIARFVVADARRRS